MKKYGIVTHYFFYGSCQALYDYLNNKKKYKINFIEIPLDFSENFLKKEIKINKNKKVKILNSKNIILNYFIQFFYSFYFQLKYFKNTDHVISCNPFNCFITILLKRFISIKKISYFSIDYSSKRFENFLLNKLYLLMDLFCYIFSDENWDISEKMLNGRKQNFKYLSKKKLKKKIKIVPVGVWHNYLKKIKKNKLIKFAYIGDINYRSGSEDIIDYISLLEKEYYKLYYIGDGELLKNIKNNVKKLCLRKNVKFISWVNQKKLQLILKTIDFGFAPYRNLEHNKNMFPTKIITFMSNSVPIFTTGNNYISRKVIKSEAGILLSKTTFLNNFNRIKSNFNLRQKLIFNAYNFSKKYKWEEIFKNALS